MRKLFLSLLVASMIMPAGAAMAAEPASSVDPAHPAVQPIRQKADPQMLNEILGDAAMVTNLKSNMCNPVVYAYQASKGNEVVAKKLEMKTAIYNAQDNPLTADCEKAVNSTQFVQDMRNSADNMDNAILNILQGLVGNALDVKKIAKAVNFKPSTFAFPNAKGNIKAFCDIAEDQRSTLMRDVKTNQVGRVAITSAARKGGTMNFNFSKTPPKNSGGGDASTSKNAVRVPAQTQQRQQPAPAAKAPQQQAPAQSAPTEPGNIYQ